MNLEFQFVNNHVVEYYEFINSCDLLTKDAIGENHHIFPKSIFGNNNILVRLSYKNHFKAHWYLAKIYEEEGLKREYMQMAKAFFSFIRIQEYRKEVLSTYTEIEIDELSNLVNEAKEHNRLSSIGKCNPFYGKTHSPETIAKMLENRNYIWTEEHRIKYIEFCKNRTESSISKHWYYNPETFENIRVSQNFIDSGELDNTYIAGRYTPEYERLTRSMKAKEFTSNFSFEWVKRGADSPLYNTKHIFNPNTGVRQRISSENNLPDGFIYSLGMSEEGKQSIRDGAKKKIGKPAPWVANITNKDPIKIKKTADKHRGMKRSEESKQLMKIKRFEYFNTGGTVSNSGQKKIFNMETRKVSYISTDLIENYLKLNPEYTIEKLIKVSDLIGNTMLILPHELLPVGYFYSTSYLNSIK